MERPEGISEDFIQRASQIIKSLKAAGQEVTVETVREEYDKVYGISPFLLLVIGPFLEWLIPFILRQLVGAKK